MHCNRPFLPPEMVLTTNARRSRPPLPPLPPAFRQRSWCLAAGGCPHLGSESHAQLAHGSADVDSGPVMERIGGIACVDFDGGGMRLKGASGGRIEGLEWKGWKEDLGEGKTNDSKDLFMSWGENEFVGMIRRT